MCLGTPVTACRGFGKTMTGKEYRAWLAEYDFIGVAARKRHQREQREAQASAEPKKQQTMETPKTKKCKTCGAELPLSEFSACVLTKDRLQSSCKRCMSERQRKGRMKKAAAMVATQEQPQPTPEPEALRMFKVELEETVTAAAYAHKIGDIPDWVLSAELRRRGYIVKVYKECAL